MNIMDISDVSDNIMDIMDISDVSDNINSKIHKIYKKVTIKHTNNELYFSRYTTKSFRTLDAAINQYTTHNLKCLNSDYLYIFKQYYFLTNYTVDTLPNLIKFQSTKCKFNMFQLIFYDRPFRLCFYLLDLNHFNDICTDLNINIDIYNVLICKYDNKYLIIVSNYYFKNKYELDIYIDNYNKYNIIKFNNNYYPYIYNNNITLISPYTLNPFGFVIHRIKLFPLSILNPLILKKMLLIDNHKYHKYTNIYHISNIFKNIIPPCEVISFKTHNITYNISNTFSTIFNTTINNNINNINNNLYLFKVINYNFVEEPEVYYISDTLDNYILINNVQNDYYLYQYINQLQPIKLYFYINILDNIQNICNILNINIYDIIIIDLSTYNSTIFYKTYLKYHYKYLIIHKFKYFSNKSEYSLYLYNLELYHTHINIEIKNYIPFIFNDNINVLHFNNNNFEILDIDKLQLFKYSMVNLIEPNSTHLLDSKINNYIEHSKQYVDYNDFDNNVDIIFIKSNMGSGKSTSMINFINNINDIDNKKILIITSRITLGNTIYQKFNDSNIKFKHYLHLNKSNNETIQNCNRLIISPDSLTKMKSPLNIYDLVWIDEATSLITYLADYPFYGISNILTVLFRIIYQSKQLILTDAHIDKIIILIYTNIKKSTNYQFLFYHNYIQLNEIIYLSNADIKLHIKDDIINNKNLYLCTDSIRETYRLFEFCKLFIPEEHILLFNRDTAAQYDKFIIQGVDEFWIKYKIVIVSPKVIYGIDFTKLHFHKTYGIYRGGMILSGREANQQLYRIRSLIDKKITINLITKQRNLIADIYTLSYNFQHETYDRLFYNMSTININNNILKLLRFEYNSDNYRILSRSYPYNLMILFYFIEHNLSLNNFIIFN